MGVNSPDYISLREAILVSRRDNYSEMSLLREMFENS